MEKLIPDEELDSWRNLPDLPVNEGDIIFTIEDAMQIKRDFQRSRPTSVVTKNHHHDNTNGKQINAEEQLIPDEELYSWRNLPDLPVNEDDIIFFLEDAIQIKRDFPEPTEETEYVQRSRPISVVTKNHHHDNTNGKQINAEEQLIPDEELDSWRNLPDLPVNEDDIIFFIEDAIQFKRDFPEPAFEELEDAQTNDFVYHQKDDRCTKERKVPIKVSVQELMSFYPPQNSNTNGNEQHGSKTKTSRQLGNQICDREKNIPTKLSIDPAITNIGLINNYPERCVYFGRGLGVTEFVGNRAYRYFVNKYRPYYQSLGNTRSTEKAGLKRSIYLAWRSISGEFMIIHPSQSPGGDCSVEVASESESMKKIGHSLRCRKELTTRQVMNEKAKMIALEADKFMNILMKQS